ncbi:hypothetical protein TeGR_g9900, partial [Tetraparma gracilis]
VSSLIESGMLKYNDKSVDLKSDVDDLVVPDNVQAVIASRLAGLTTSQQSILQTASVIGRTFTLGMVTDVHPASEMLQTLSADLKEIVRKRLVERTVGSGGGDDADGELQFSHKFVQESIYESCLVSTRKQVHKAIAKHLELDQSKQLSDSYALIAHHYVQAEEWRSACLYLQLSSEVSARLEMQGAVIKSLTQWMHIREEKLGQSDDKKAEAINGRFGTARIETGIVCLTLGKALLAMVKYDEALKMFAAGAAKIGHPYPATTAAKVRVILRGLSHLQWMASTGSMYKINSEPSEAELKLAECTLLASNVHFRYTSDMPAYLALLLYIPLHTARPAKSMVAMCSLFGSVIGPSVGLTSISDHMVREVNRLAGTCTGADAAMAGGFLNTTNGCECAGKGELRQATGFFQAAAKEFYKDREMFHFANVTTFAAMFTWENGHGKKSFPLISSGLKKASESGIVAPMKQHHMYSPRNARFLCSLQFLAGCCDEAAWMSDDEVAEVLNTYDAVPVSAWQGYCPTSLHFLLFRAGRIDLNEFSKWKEKEPQECSFSIFFTGDRVASTVQHLELYVRRANAMLPPLYLTLMSHHIIA